MGENWGGLPKIVYANLNTEIINEIPIELKASSHNYNYVAFDINIRKDEKVNVKFKLKDKVGDFETIDVTLANKINGGWYKNDRVTAYISEDEVNINLIATKDLDGVLIYAGNIGNTTDNGFTISSGDLTISKIEDITKLYQGQNHIGYLKDNNDYFWKNFNN